MSWALKRIQQYIREGQEPTWLEQRVFEHANPVNFIVHIIALVVLFYGLWMHSWCGIIGGIGIAFIGHLYVWFKKD